ncbi:MAG: hypothetical protein RLZZ24_1058 [Pseudomonadota bacterium]|jgi:hypothetical protein
MYEVFFAVAANRIIVDAKTSQISIIDLYEKLQTSGFPVVIPKLSLLFYVSRQKMDEPVCSPTLICQCGDEEPILTTVINVDFKDLDVTRVVVALDNFSIPKPGLLSATLKLGEREWGHLDLEVALGASDPHPHVVKSGKFNYRVS